MQRTDPQSLSELLQDFFEQRKLRGALIEGRAVEVWAEVVGEYVASFTEDVYIRDGILYLSFSSAAVRSEIHIRKRFFVAKINEAIGAKAVKNIVIR
ncbi:Zn-ribbon-containing protein [Mucinivorans hirudinis]|uniref:Zn-ribbon-containing protein n=1 Tax=Mucinivorans hirudinis TaxID=1433126 RepID=A0A060REB7_9BACT|nr:Zn-ribbon-containing protein [Mucinivorans hirudinis]